MRKKVFSTVTIYDKLTQLPNHHLFYDRLGQAMASSKRTGRYIALMLINLDNFKLLNNMHKPSIGDLLLVEVANRLKRNVRDVDTVARFASDKFVVMLNELGLDRAESIVLSHIISERLRTELSSPYLLTIKNDEVAETTIEHCGTTSIGVVTFINDDRSRDDVLELAYGAMRQAIKSGGDQICFNETTI